MAALVSPRVYRVGLGHPMVLLFFVMVLALIGLASHGPVRGGPLCMAVVVGAVLLSGLALFVLRLEVGPAGLAYRTLLSSRRVGYGQVERVAIEIERGDGGLSRVPVLRLYLAGGGTITPVVRMFPEAATALLVGQLERRGVGLEVAEAGPARRMARRIAAERLRLQRPGATVR